MRRNEKGLGGMRRDENKDEDGMNDGMELRMKEEVSPGCIILLYSSPAGYTNRYTHTHTPSLTHTHTHTVTHTHKYRNQTLYRSQYQDINEMSNALTKSKFAY